MKEQPMSRPTGAGPAQRIQVSILAFITALLLPLAATTALGQEDESRDLFVDTVDVNVVNLEVMVSDKEGNPVRGLTLDDFVVTEDGEPVELTNFYAVESARRVQPAEAEPASGYAVPELLPLPADQTLNLAVVIDVENLQPTHRNRVIDQIKAEVERVVRPGDRVMVATLSPYPEIELPFTDDVVAVGVTLDRIARARAGGHSELNVLLRQIQREFSNLQSDQFGSTAGGGQFGSAESAESSVDIARRAQNMISNYATQSDYHTRRTFEGLEAMIVSMSGLPGRKSVLYVSQGLTTRPGEYLYEALISVNPEIARELGSAQFASQRYESIDVLQDLVRSASANRVVFYTLNAEGFSTGLASADTLGLPALGVANADISSHDTMTHLAAATGGHSMLNPANADKLLDRMASDFSEYYSLGYVSPNERDGEFHRLEVRIKDRKDARVRHNEGYRASTVEQEMLDRAVSALVLDVADNPLDVRVELGDPQAEKKDQYVLPVLIKVPIAKLVLVPQQREHKGKLALYVAVRDPDGRMSKPQRFDVPVDIPNESLLAAMSREVGYGINLLVRGGDAKLAVGVRDEVGAVVSTVNLNLTVGDKVAAR
jgi:VWFA-related protein